MYYKAISLYIIKNTKYPIFFKFFFIFSILFTCISFIFHFKLSKQLTVIVSKVFIQFLLSLCSGCLK